MRRASYLKYEVSLMQLSSVGIRCGFVQQADFDMDVSELEVLTKVAFL